MIPHQKRMIITFKHKGLRQFYKTGNGAGIDPKHTTRTGLVLLALDEANNLRDLQPYRCHPLKGDMSGLHALTVTGNWRIVFRFEEGHAFDVDLVDYH